MTSEVNRAAQYIRMSSDRQDLSPLVQKEAIAVFAGSHSLEVVATYEDGGKSGVQISNRPEMRQLLNDVGEGAPFSHILVYDVSRWGRFQDPDAAAYYEYHCRLHGVQVIYTNEMFANEQTAAGSLMKNMKRAMAAEYSRELAFKCRAGQHQAISMGFHMGALPPLGYRRCSVSADGLRRVPLEHGQRKLALTDRVEWVLGPDREVQLVRRICDAYVGGLALEDIAGLVDAEGWRTEKGRSFSTQSAKVLLRHEALIGNFVWGKSKGQRIIKCTQTRMNGSVPRIIDDKTWTLIQTRLRKDRVPPTRGESAATPGDSGSSRRPRQLNLSFGLVKSEDNYRRRLGTPQQLRDHTRAFGRAICAAIKNVGIPAAFDTRTNVLTFWHVRVRIRLMWPCNVDGWRLERSRSVQQTQYVLVSRMRSLFHPMDYFVLPQRFVSSELSNRVLAADPPRKLRSYWSRSPTELMDRLSAIAGSAGHTAESQRGAKVSGQPSGQHDKTAPARRSEMTATQ